MLLHLNIHIWRSYFLIENCHLIFLVETSRITTIANTKYGPIKMDTSIVLAEKKENISPSIIQHRFECKLNWKYLPQKQVWRFSHWCCCMNVWCCQSDSRFTWIDSNATRLVQTFNAKDNHEICGWIMVVITHFNDIIKFLWSELWPKCWWT